MYLLANCSKKSYGIKSFLILFMKYTDLIQLFDFVQKRFTCNKKLHKQLNYMQSAASIHILKKFHWTTIFIKFSNHNIVTFYNCSLQVLKICVFTFKKVEVCILYKILKADDKNKHTVFP